MRLPARSTIGSPAEWRELCERLAAGLDPARLVIVHTPSAAAYVQANFGWAKASRRCEMAGEPDVKDFAGLDDFPGAPQLVVGIGGGKALDAAKAVAQWGTLYASAGDMGRVLASGARVEQPRGTGLILAPSLASSGSEASQAAIISIAGRKSGLRGSGLVADSVVHDRRLWTSVTRPVALHYAFDIFAHLLETTVSLRRTDDSLAHAANGFARLGRWLFKQDASLDHYGEAMEASFEAGICLATSSTCLPHRIQYIIGPATGTSHVEGVWYVSRGWFPLAARVCPERVADAARMWRAGGAGPADFREVFESIHHQAAALVRRDRFLALPQRGRQLAAEVSGDLKADPTFAGIETIENLITGKTYD